MKLTQIRAIRAKCLDCCAGQRKEVRRCTCEICALFPYRLAHRPKAEDLPTEETNGEKTRGYEPIFE